MSHRPEDHYEYVATEDVYSGFVRAFAIGDPVPGDTVAALGLLDSGQVCHRDELADVKAAITGEPAPARPMKRGDMPPHLVDDSAEPSSEAGSGDELVKPSADATKSVWVDYATDERNEHGISHDEAQGMTKSALMEMYK